MEQRREERRGLEERGEWRNVDGGYRRDAEERSGHLEKERGEWSGNSDVRRGQESGAIYKDEWRYVAGDEGETWKNEVDKMCGEVKRREKKQEVLVLEGRKIDEGRARKKAGC